MPSSIRIAAMALAGALATSACETEEDMAMWAELGGMFLDAAVMADAGGDLGLGGLGGLSDGSGELGALSNLLAQAAAAGASDVGDLSGDADMAALTSLLAAAAASGSDDGLALQQTLNSLLASSGATAAAGGGLSDPAAFQQTLNALLAASMAAGAGNTAGGALPGSVPVPRMGVQLKPNLAATPACAGFTESNYQQMAMQGGGDTQLYVMCGAAFNYYAMYKNAIAQGYSAADAERTYDAHRQSALVANNFARDWSAR
jgi:hypothetical protein